MHAAASTGLSALYYSSVRIHNLHIHLSLPFPLLLRVANRDNRDTSNGGDDIKPIVQVFSPEAEPNSPEATKAAIKGDDQL